MWPPLGASEKKEFNTEGTEGYRGMRYLHLLESLRHGRRRATAICGGGCGRGFGDSDASGGCAMVAGFGARGRRGDDASISGKAGERTGGCRGRDASLPVSVHGAETARSGCSDRSDRHSGERGERGGKNRAGPELACRR